MTSDYHWWANLPPGAAFLRPDGVVIEVAAAPPDAPVCPSPNHGWLSEVETDRGAWYPLKDVRAWERA